MHTTGFLDEQADTLADWVLMKKNGDLKFIQSFGLARSYDNVQTHLNNSHINDLQNVSHDG